MIAPATLARIDAARALIRAGRLPHYEATVCAWCRRPLSRGAFDTHPNGRAGHRSACHRCEWCARLVRHRVAAKAAREAKVETAPVIKDPCAERNALADIQAVLQDDSTKAAKMARPALAHGPGYALGYLRSLRDEWYLAQFCVASPIEAARLAAEVKRLDEIVALIREVAA